MCQCYNPLPHYVPTVSNPLLGGALNDFSSHGGVVPFVACGDLSQYDSDMTYPVKVCVHACVCVCVCVCACACACACACVCVCVCVSMYLCCVHRCTSITLIVLQGLYHYPCSVTLQGLHRYCLASIKFYL